MEATTLESIVKSETSTPIFFDEDEEEFLPLKSEPKIKSALQPPSDPIPAMENEPTPPAKNPTVEDSIPCCSNCIAEKPEQAVETLGRRLLRQAQISQGDGGLQAGSMLRCPSGNKNSKGLASIQN